MSPIAYPELRLPTFSKPPMKHTAWLIAGLLAVTNGGCRSVATPDWMHPGSAAVQQSRAVRYDPYPENDAGPSLADVRPRDYETPLAEPARARWIVDRGGQNAARWPQPAPCTPAPSAAAPPPAAAPATPCPPQ